MGFGLGFSLLSLFSGWSWVGDGEFLGLGVSLGSIFCLDYVGFSLSFLSVIIFVSLLFWWDSLCFFSRLMLSASVFFSVLCYLCCHAFWFWVFYEMSIVPLLVLLAVDSPYSERFVALWYFSGYVVLSSLPMLLCFLYLSEFWGVYDFRSWGSCGADGVLLGVCVLLGVLFVTKIPLLPFQVWLPIVHAEASSPVSVCLSGYVMKLGLLGVFRFCWELVPGVFFSQGYVLLCLLASIGFFLGALRELDAKRWLALLSLGHISICVACLSLMGWKVFYLCFVYCLGHGLSAAAVFIFIWLISNISGSRSLVLMKHAFWGSFSFRVCLALALGTVCCVPPSVQFFSELFLVVESVWLNNWFLSILLYFYVFFGGLVPVLFFGALVSRQYDVSYAAGHFFVPLGSIVFLIFWSFVLFLVC